MTQEDFIQNSIRFMEQNIDQIKTIYFSNSSESQEAILVINGLINYISKNNHFEIYSGLSDSQKNMITSLEKNEFLVIIGDEGFFSYFKIPNTNADLSNLSFLKLKDEYELVDFCRYINETKELHSDGLAYDFKDVDDESIVLTIFELLMSNITDNKLTSEKFYQEILMYCYLKFNKITKSEDGNYEITSQNMYRNFNEIEKYNFIYIFDILIEFAQKIAKVALSDEDYDNFNLDLINMSTLIGQTEGIKLDENITGYNHLIGMLKY